MLTRGENNDTQADLTEDHVRQKRGGAKGRVAETSEHRQAAATTTTTAEEVAIMSKKPTSSPERTEFGVSPEPRKAIVWTKAKDAVSPKSPKAIKPPPPPAPPPKKSG